MGKNEIFSIRGVAPPPAPFPGHFFKINERGLKLGVIGPKTPAFHSFPFFIPSPKFKLAK